jgi:hypothetical protein
MISARKKRSTVRCTLVKAEEWRFVILIMVAVLVITSLPYVFGYISAPQDQQFMGLIFNVPDHAQYFSWYRDFQTANLVSNRMTPEPTAPLFFNLLWWVLARIGLYTGLSHIHVFLVFRLVAVGAFLLMLYYFCSLVFEQVGERKSAFLLIAFTSGLGWILIVLKYTVTQGVLLFPLDVYRAGANSFLSMMAYPHFTIANALILALFALFLVGYERQQLRYALAAGVVAIILGWQHVYDLITIYGVLGVFFVLETVRLRSVPWYLVKAGLVLAVLSVWSPLYAVYLTNFDPTWQEVLAQFGNAGVFTADPFHMIILVGLPLVVAVLTFDGFACDGRWSKHELFIKTWFLTSFVLGYLPVGYQVHLTNLWQVPVGILAIAGLFRQVAPYSARVLGRWKALRWSREQVQRLVVVCFVLLCSLTNVYLWMWRFVDLARHEHPYYLYNEELAAMDWLADNADPDDVVLSSLTTGQYVPVFSDSHAFISHWAQTLDFFGKLAVVDEFFVSGTDDTWRQDVLEQYSVDYVFCGPVERDLGGCKLESSPFLRRVYASSLVEIYQVRDE